MQATPPLMNESKAWKVHLFQVCSESRIRATPKKKSLDLQIAFEQIPGMMRARAQRVW